MAVPQESLTSFSPCALGVNSFLYAFFEGGSGLCYLVLKVIKTQQSGLLRKDHSHYVSIQRTVYSD